MNPSKVDRNRMKCLTDLPNVGPAMAADLELLGIAEPAQVAGRDPYEMYDELCRRTGVRHDPCVIDLFVSITRFMDGGEPRPWWEFTEERRSRPGAGGRGRK